MPKLSDRLAKLETHTGDALPTDALPLLVAILARRDALFWPARSPNLALILLQRQRAYREKSLGIAARADGRANWKSAHHHRKALIEAGLVEPLSSGGQVTSLLLTAKGEAIARGLIGLESASSVAVIAEGFPRSWTHERELLGFEGEYSTDQAIPFTEVIFPLLIEGAIEVRCDSRKGLWYRGVGEVESKSPDVTLIEASSTHQATYDKAFLAERDALESSEPLDPYEVFIPVPVGL
ncbi:hypothetical protein SH467x_001239 [Pirellulaceae bacterium SH467]